MGEMNMIYFLTAVIIILLAVLAVVYIRMSRLLTRLDDMIESAIKGSFAESEYSEKRLWIKSSGSISTNSTWSAESKIESGIRSLTAI